MRLKIVFLSYILCYYFGRNECFKIDRIFNDVKSKCEAICIESGGKAEFKTETEICKCLLNKTVDDTEIELMQKNAKILGIILETIEPIVHEKIIIERDTTKAETTQIETTDSTSTLLPITTSNIETVINPNPEGIVGQQAPGTRRKLNLLSQRHQLTPHHSHLPTSNIEQQKIIIQQIRDQLNHLSKTDDKKTRLSDIDAIRGNLKQLSHSIAIENPLQKARIPSDRLKDIVQQVREKQQQHRLIHHSPHVGLPFPHLTAKENHSHGTAKQHNENRPNEVNENEKRFKLPKPVFEVITQNPSLVDE